MLLAKALWRVIFGVAGGFMKCVVNIFSDSELKFSQESFGAHYSHQVAQIAKLWNAAKLGFHVEALEPGTFSCPYHLHHLEEELLIVLKGKATVRLDGSYFEVKEGDLVFFKTGVAHQIYNHTTEPFRFFALSNNFQDEICEYPDSSKRWDRRLKSLTQNGEEIKNYWKDEENPRSRWPEVIMSRETKKQDGRPTLTTDRLVLRPFQVSDAKRVQELAGHPNVAAATATIPHPYPDGAAEKWIGDHGEWYRKGAGVQFAITLKKTEELIGCIALGISANSSRAELGYWVGVEYWNHGYCSEAAKEVIKYGVETIGLNKITSRHMSTNPASGRVMLNAGLKKEGVLRQEFQRNGQYYDLEVYGLLRNEY